MYGRARLILLVLLPSAAHSQSLFPSGLARFAGKDNSAYTGDNGPAYYAKFRTPAALTRDAAGNLYIAEAARIRKIDTRGTLTKIAGIAANSVAADALRKGRNERSSARPRSCAAYLSLPFTKSTDFSSASSAESNNASPLGRSGRFWPCGPRQKSW